MYVKNTYVTGAILGVRSGVHSPGNDFFFTLVNTSPQTISLYYINDAGERILYTSLMGPFSTISQACWETDAWEIRDAKGKVLVDYTSTDDSYVWDGVTLSGYRRDITVKNIAGAKFSSEYGYGLINVAKALGLQDRQNTAASLENGNSAALNEINAFGVTQSGITGKGVIVAILDSGIDKSIPSLAGRIINGFDFGNNDNDPSPYNSLHGDGIAGIIGAASNSKNVIGLAPEATILNIRISSDEGGATYQKIADAIRYAVDHGAKIISLSQTQKYGIDVIQPLVEAARYAIQNNVLIVSAAGNDSFPYIAGPSFNFKNLDTLIVGNWDLQYDKMFYSSNWAGDNPVNFVVAPSSGWTTASGSTFQYYRDGGTSFATPYVSGLAALIFQQHPDWTIKQVIERIINTSTFIEPPAPSYYPLSNTINTINGGANSDLLIGTANNDYFYCGAGNDSIKSLDGDDIIDGGEGNDIVYFKLSLQNYNVAYDPTTSRVKVISKVGSEGTEIIFNVESLEFLDKSVNLTIQAEAAAAPKADIQRLMELYVAFFNRIPDANGLAYWIDQMANGQKIPQIAESFYNAGVQFSSLTGFSATMTNSDFINVIYRNVLGRVDGADSGGLAYWNGELTSNRATRGSLVLDILTAAHTFKNDATYGYVANLLDNKIDVAQRMAIDWGLSYNTASDSISQGMLIASKITPTGTAEAIALVGISSNDIHLG